MEKEIYIVTEGSRIRHNGKLYQAGKQIDFIPGAGLLKDKTVQKIIVDLPEVEIQSPPTEESEVDVPTRGRGRKAKES